MPLASESTASVGLLQTLGIRVYCQKPWGPTNLETISQRSKEQHFSPWCLAKEHLWYWHRQKPSLGCEVYFNWCSHSSLLYNEAVPVSEGAGRTSTRVTLTEAQWPTDRFLSGFSSWLFLVVRADLVTGVDYVDTVALAMVLSYFVEQRVGSHTIICCVMPFHLFHAWGLQQSWILELSFPEKCSRTSITSAHNLSQSSEFSHCFQDPRVPCAYPWIM